MDSFGGVYVVAGMPLPKQLDVTMIDKAKTVLEKRHTPIEPPVFVPVRRRR